MTELEAFVERCIARCTKEGDCLIWPGAMGGTPQARFKNKTIAINRAVYEVVHGCCPDHLGVFRLCGNVRCLSWEHLFCGTQAEFEERQPEAVSSARRRQQKARSLVARQSAGNALTETQVRAIREAKARGETLAHFTKEFGVSDATVYNAANGFTFRDDGVERPTRGRPGYYRSPTPWREK